MPSRFGLAKCDAISEGRKIPELDAINASKDPAVQKALRNEFITSSIYTIRTGHRTYWNNAARHRAVLNFTIDTLIAGSTAVVASAGGVGTKAAIGAAATAFSAIKGAFSSDFDAGQSRSQLLVAMQVNSSKNEDAINGKLSSPYAEYGVMAACADLDKYYASGSELYTYATVSPEVPKVATNKDQPDTTDSTNADPGKPGTSKQKNTAPAAETPKPAERPAPPTN